MAYEGDHLERHEGTGGDHHEPRSPPPSALERAALHEREGAVERQSCGDDPEVARDELADERVRERAPWP